MLFNFIFFSGIGALQVSLASKVNIFEACLFALHQVRRSAYAFSNADCANQIWSQYKTTTKKKLSRKT